MDRAQALASRSVGRYLPGMHTVPLGPRRTRVSLYLGLILALIMIVVGIVALSVNGPLWFAIVMLVAGVAIGALAIIRLVLLRRT